MSAHNLRIGLIGLDTSHVTAFADILHNEDHPFHIPGARITIAYSSVSDDFEMSYARVAGFTEQLQNEYRVQVVASPEEVVEASDMILLESVDGRVHYEQFKRIAAYGKPVFIDKPLALSYQEAKAILDLAAHHQLPVMSCSALRYSQALIDAIADKENGEIFGMDCSGPMAIQPTQPGLFWYGIHMVEMLYAGLGEGCKQVTAVSNEDGDFIVGEWLDGRVGTLRGNRLGNNKFGALLHRQQGTQFLDVSSHPKPYYSGMLEEILAMYRNKISPIDPAEMLEIIRFMEASNESRATGETVRL
ncbi:gfo/Idh/MocA family oxidoreductase [Paenibacillus psychroresistens]|uniref:Gfo/Idh/MocA family oxidoreductase n=1 Tax=Paenibacillus psychroresistens TaxID=1778678 RepID=A0A6B8RFC1_9BACL|nr:Gfo/Idh/MocA family oxidoreductase [Paenibacillus psychroresistens]QGQ94223.1 gfo/Idh/MocA family oxidoreductase [Paenibacillus psychroresistens]